MEDPSAWTSALASLSSFAASVTAVGSPRATSSANPGPDRIAVAAAGAASAITSVMNRCVPRSMPLAQAMIGVARARRGAIAITASRRCCAGVAISTISARAARATSQLNAMFGARRTPGNFGLTRVAAISAAFAALRA